MKVLAGSILLLALAGCSSWMQPTCASDQYLENGQCVYRQPQALPPRAPQPPQTYQPQPYPGYQRQPGPTPQPYRY